MIKLPILWTDDEQNKLEELGLKVQQDYTNTRIVRFININALSPHFENDQEFTLIHCNNEVFMCTKPIKEVEQIIEEYYSPKIVYNH